ncbi:alpha/beta hydrolase [Deinococcus peraridilitoris]|uniref:Enterochelin esterase-like enzyme n=1 Tax=Deinococcus peraridilitoris (strain DSM 19664 / LMG 22246 / CIP 109416 / KR-200) TaxID=937777 RepID=L0A4Q1_DEIPD|nr:esterase family protein [Deinococcus peraridilitoris]AFZ68000.1 enterochelin esterase-like enzyme [Deinococcus peraridilitoris DSM 19664]
MAVFVEGTTAVFTPPPGARHLVGDFTDWQNGQPIPAAPEIRVALPRDSWTEYAWIGENGKPFADPDNDTRSLNPWWPYPRAVEVGTYARHPLWTAPAAQAGGKVDRLAWEGGVFPGTRRASVYMPPGYDPGQLYPVFYIQDGVAFLRTGKLGELLDKAIEAGLARPAVLVFLEPGDRSREYYLNDAYLEFLTQEVFPRIEDAYSVSREAEGRGLWGASLGGLISLYLGSHHPELFSTVVAHSGAFIARPDAYMETRVGQEWLLRTLRERGAPHLRVSLDSGVLEWLLAPNRRMAALLADLNIPHQYREYQSGHNWVTWRAALPEALLFALGT